MEKGITKEVRDDYIKTERDARIGKDCRKIK